MITFHLKSQIWSLTCQLRSYGRIVGLVKLLKPGTNLDKYKHKCATSYQNKADNSAIGAEH